VTTTRNPSYNQQKEEEENEQCNIIFIERTFFQQIYNEKSTSTMLKILSQNTGTEERELKQRLKKSHGETIGQKPLSLARCSL
jgi:hypothetical protein